MTNPELAALFVELADIMEIAAENHFKIRSYRMAADNISQLDRPIESMSSDEIKAIPGIGKAIFEKISEALETGTFATLEKWRASGYASFLPLLDMPAATPRKIGAAISRLQVESMDDIRRLVDGDQTKRFHDINDDIRKMILNHISRG